MIKRYTNKVIEGIWSLEHKFALWQEMELAVIKVRCEMGKYPKEVWKEMSDILNRHPIDVAWIKEKEKETKHDLNAFLLERLRFLENKYHKYFHDGMTSYDTEEAPFSQMLWESTKEVEGACEVLCQILKSLALKHRYTPMLGRTHGQEAKLQSFGLRVLRWYLSLRYAQNYLETSVGGIKYSKLSGAIGNYQGITPDEEKAALKASFGLKPFVGASQIMPRILHQPLANNLLMVVGALTQIAEDIRLSARSGSPLLQEPFDPKQMGSSAMPHKKNTIFCENQIGMWRMAKGFAGMIQDNIVTWEERAIEQSSVERVAWPDLFHVVMQSFKNMTGVLERLKVFSDNMMLEIDRSHGCYASEDAKELLKKLGEPYGLSYEDAYRIVQLAAAMAHEVGDFAKHIRVAERKSYPDLKEIYRIGDSERNCVPKDIRGIIAQAHLHSMEGLASDGQDVARWNEILEKIFSNADNKRTWGEIFSIEYQLRNESFIFETHK